MSYQTDQENMNAGGYYPDNYQVEVTNMQGIGFNQGFTFGCGFWLAALILWFMIALPCSLSYFYVVWYLIVNQYLVLN